jgi:Spy/CpxP family protein refolding chaperone
MKTNNLLSFAFGIAMLLGLAATAGARQGGSSPATPPPSAAPSGSQSGSGAAGKHGKMSADTPEDDPALHLTDDQKTKIDALRADTKDQLKAINKDTTLSDTDKEAKVKDLRKTTRAQVWAILTPDQQKIWMADARAEREAKKSGGASQ